MSEDVYISFYLKHNSINIHKNAIEAIGKPLYIRFLINQDGSSMIIQPYYKKDFNSFRVPTAGTWDMRISSKALCTVISNRHRWEKDCSFRVPGKTIKHQNIVVFDLLAAQRI